MLLCALWKLYQAYKWKTCKPNVSGKVVFVSGGSSGIGEALAKQMIKMGAKKVIIAARRVEELERVKRECARPDAVQTFQLDLSKPEECSARCKELFSKEQVDILINNGGCSQRDLFEELDFSTMQSMMNINCMSHIAVTKAIFEQMKKRGSGKIVNVLSITGYLGTPMRCMYAASKFGLNGFGKVLRCEGARHGIQVTQVYPYYVKTNISKNALTGDGQTFGKVDANIAKGMPVEKAISFILKGMELDIAELTIGGTYYKVLYHVAHLLPQSVYDHFAAKTLRKQIDARDKAK